jgi:potassium-dependent mechanosensitive channel
MQTAPTALEVLSDFWLSFTKLLGRPVVQMQLVAALAALLLAWLLTRWLVGAMRRQNEARVQRVRAEVLAEEQARPATKGSDGDSTVRLLVDEQAIDEAVRERLGLGQRVYLFAMQLVYPVPAILLLYGAYVYFVARGWYAGLLADLIFLLAIYLLYRLALGLAYAVGNPRRVRYYHQRLFGPLFGVLFALLFINTVIPLETVASATLFALQDGWLTVGVAFVAVFGFCLWFMGLNLIKDLIKAFAARRGQVNIGSLDAALTLMQYVLVVMGLYAVLRVLQFDTTTIAAITGGLFIGVGLALQDVIKNFLGGIIVLFEGSVRPGDWIEIAGAEGEVASLSIRSTVVRTFDNVEYIVPNQDWLNSTVTTFTRNSRKVRTRVPIGVSYGSDPHFVQQLLVELARAHPDVLTEPPPVAPLIDFGESSVDFVVLAWVEDAKIKARVASELRLRIWDAFQANGIEIPFPQRDLYIRSGLSQPGPGIQGEATQ